VTAKAAVSAAPAGYLAEGSLALKGLKALPGPMTPTAKPLPTDPSRGSASQENIGRNAVIVARAMLEVLAGWRPASQLARWTSYPLQQDLERRAPRRPTGNPLQLLRIRASEQSPGIVEICALAEDTHRKRVRVIAMRLERREGDWVVTRLQAG
jgi:hypothetical protein